MNGLQLVDRFVKDTFSPLAEGLKSDFLSNFDLLRDQYSIYEKDGKYVVEVAVPGLSGQEIKVNVDKEHRLLKISAKKVEEEKEENEGEIIWHHKGKMDRSFSLYLPKNVILESVNAESRDGQVRVTFDLVDPAEAEKERMIEVPIAHNKA